MPKPPELDKIIHQPVRTSIMSYLISTLSATDFNTLLEELELTKGNLSSHITILEKAGYIKVNKKFIGKVPNTSYEVTAQGRKAFDKYVQALEAIVKKAK